MIAITSPVTMQVCYNILFTFPMLHITFLWLICNWSTSESRSPVCQTHQLSPVWWPLACFLYLSLFLFYLFITLFFRFYEIILYFTFWLSSLSIIPPDLSMFPQMARLYSFYGWVIFHYIYVHLFYPFICGWTLRLLPYLGYCK